MASIFAQRKKKILVELALDQPDSSPKGYVDEEILQLVRLLNEAEGVVTTSSCAGRVAVYLEGRKGETPDSGVENSLSGPLPAKELQSAAFGGKGLGGQWLFVSHKPLESGTLPLALQSQSGAIDPAVIEPKSDEFKTAVDGETRLLHLKFEPMVCL